MRKTCKNLYSLHFLGYRGKEEGLKVEGDAGAKVAIEVWKFPGREREEGVLGYGSCTYESHECWA